MAEYDRLVARRDELIFAGVDPDELLVPLPPSPDVGRIRVCFEPYDWRVGLHVTPGAFHIHLLPMLVIRCWRNVRT